MTNTLHLRSCRFNFAGCLVYSLMQTYTKCFAKSKNCSGFILFHYSKDFRSAFKRLFIIYLFLRRIIFYIKILAL